MAKIDRKAMREKLARRTQESYERKDGGISTKYFNAESDLPLWKCDVTKDEPHIIDIIPFYAGSQFPQIDKRNPVEKDDEVYVLDIFVHTNVGPAKEMIVCPTKNYGKPCPICEEIERMINEDGAEYEDYSALAPKRRCVYNIICYDTDKQEKKGIQVWEVSHKYSEKILTALAKNSAARGGGVIAFSDPDQGIGQSISFEVANDTYRTVSGHKLLPRDYDITDEIIDSTYSLDDHLTLLSYEEINEKAFRSKSDAEEESDSKSKRGGRSRNQEPDEEDTPKSRRGRKEEGKEDIDNEKISSRRKRKSFDDEESDDEEEVPVKPKRKGRKEEPEEEVDCPNGEFGNGFDTFEDCDDCSLFDDCEKEYGNLQAKKKKTSSRRR